MLSEILIVVIKASNRSQCPLDWFITHALTTRFKQEVISSNVSLYNSSNLGFRNSLLQCHYFLLAITKKDGFFEFKTFLKHNDFVYKLFFDNVLINVLSLQGGNPLSTQAFSHSYFPFPYFFV
jgi:hypothetical protein